MIFLDTNILVYAVDGKYPVKQDVARKIVSSALDSEKFVISAQVLNEFSNIAILKLGMVIGEVRDFISIFRRIRTVPLEPEWTDRALSIKDAYRIQFFYSLLLAAAEANGCDEIWTEDLNDGQFYCGIKAANPFVAH